MKRFENTDIDAIDALAKELGVKGRAIKEMSNDGYSHYEPDYTFGVNLPDGDHAVYLVYDNQEMAEVAAADDLGEQFQEDPSILGAAIKHFGFSTLREYLNGLDEEELDELESLKDDLYEEEFAEYVQSNIGVDYRGFAEFCVNEFGPAWHIANYDGREVELANGMMAYRVE